MLRWLAPLWLLVSKPEVLLRILVIAIAGAALIFGVRLISDIALTFDALKSHYIAVIYGSVLLCFFSGVTVLAWPHVRSSAGPPAKKQQKAAPPRQPDVDLNALLERAERASATLFGKPAGSDADDARAIPAAQPRSVPRATFVVTGPADAGKTAIIKALAQTAGADVSGLTDIVCLRDGGTFEDNRGYAALRSRMADTDGVLFVVANDLRASDVVSLAGIGDLGKPIYVVFNKSDQFSPADRDTILLAIQQKLPNGIAPDHVVAAAAAPRLIEREIRDKGGTRVEARQPPADVSGLTRLLALAVKLPAGRKLRFEAE